MKAVLITHNQSFTERVEYLLERLNLKGYTQFTEVKGRGSRGGEPRMGTHTWPEINVATFVVVDDEVVDTLLQKVHNLDMVNEEIGIRAFVWDILKTI